MTVSEKHAAAARDVFRSYLRRIEYDRRACFEHDELMQEMIAAALAAAEREGMRRAAGIASQCGVDAVEFAKKHIGERHIDFLRFQDGCEASAAAIRNQANTHSPDSSHQVNSPASTSSPEPGTHSSRSALSAGSDGNPSKPSPADGCVKMDGASTPAPDRPDATSACIRAEAGQAVAHSHASRNGEG